MLFVPYVCYAATDFNLAFIRSESNRDHSKIKNETVKKSPEKSKNVLEEKRKMVKRNICIKKTNTFTIIAMNFAQEEIIIVLESNFERK